MKKAVGFKNGFSKMLILSFMLFAFYANPAKVHAGVSDEEYARLYADLSVKCAEVGRAQLGWLDGQDVSVGSPDAGRGVSSWLAHFAFAMNSNRRQSIPQFIESRLNSIQGVVSAGEMAKLYANISVTIATMGRDRLNWIDGMDGNAPTDDPGRGISNYIDHYNYVANGAANSPALVGERLTTMLGTVTD